MLVWCMQGKTFFLSSHEYIWDFSARDLTEVGNWWQDNQLSLRHGMKKYLVSLYKAFVLKTQNIF